MPRLRFNDGGLNLSEIEEPKLEVKLARDPKALSPEYHKAHKQLMLWSAILFIWELVGIDLSKAKEAGGNVGPIFTVLKSPQAVPWVLLLLVGYFFFKCVVEWGQCDANRRKVRYARIDFISALSVSTAAIALYITQAISHVQLADLLQTPKAESLITGMFIGAVVTFTIYQFQGEEAPSQSYALPFVAFLPLIAKLFWSYGSPLIWSFVLIGLFVGPIPIIAVAFLLKKLRPPKGKLSG